MTTGLLVPLVVCVAGALVYAFADGKPAEIGRIGFFAGLFVTLMKLA